MPTWPMSGRTIAPRWRKSQLNWTVGSTTYSSPPAPVAIRRWSLGYVRFWIVKTLIRSNPGVHLFVGSPLYGLYLRALGAKVGPRVVILSRYIPVCTDLLTIGAGTVIRRESS